MLLASPCLAKYLPHAHNLTRHPSAKPHSLRGAMPVSTSRSAGRRTPSSRLFSPSLIGGSVCRVHAPCVRPGSPTTALSFSGSPPVSTAVVSRSHCLAARKKSGFAALGGRHSVATRASADSVTSSTSTSGEPKGSGPSLVEYSALHREIEDFCCGVVPTARELEDRSALVDM